MGDDQELLTLGRLARRTGTPVRTIRYWSDIAALPPAGRSAAATGCTTPPPWHGWS
ncbi:MerR family DNA-binding transcriptional regulator [Actinacidiphila glaucinigra]|uniref:MerR family DNA-binding transcriptional regulator n=1 Tax=Actinacidiphila glaucinigra TaxID=235986 RepID=UPI0036754453